MGEAKRVSMGGGEKQRRSGRERGGFLMNGNGRAKSYWGGKKKGTDCWGGGKDRNWRKSRFSLITNTQKKGKKLRTELGLRELAGGEG